MFRGEKAHLQKPIRTTPLYAPHIETSIEVRNNRNNKNYRNIVTIKTKETS